MEAVEADRAGKVAGADQIDLMGLIGEVGREGRIFLALRYISSRSPMRQLAAAQDPADRAERG